jgi:transcriptional regulator NrdR family protein
MTGELTVIKRDGSRQPFRPQQITQVVQAAGLNPDQARKLTQTVSSWAFSLKQPEITSAKIKEKILGQLRQIDPPVAGLFQWYQKIKEKSD